MCVSCFSFLSFVSNGVSGGEGGGLYFKANAGAQTNRVGPPGLMVANNLNLLLNTDTNQKVHGGKGGWILIKKIILKQAKTNWMTRGHFTGFSQNGLANCPPPLSGYEHVWPLLPQFFLKDEVSWHVFTSEFLQAFGVGQYFSRQAPSLFRRVLERRVGLSLEQV